jgi:microcystin-dependent protein
MANSAIQGSSLIDFPAGMIMPFAGAAVPAGWLECDGSEIDIAQYPILAAALGSTWNTAKNPLTNANYAAPAAGKFRLPDMRGAFLRGSSGGVNNAQGVATDLAEFQTHKTAKNGLSNAASSLGAFTLNSSSVSGSATSGGAGYYVNGNKPNQAYSTFSAPGYRASDNSAPNGHTHGLSATAAAQSLASSTVTAQTISSTDAETRPDAVGVRYLIKY